MRRRPFGESAARAGCLPASATHWRHATLESLAIACSRDISCCACVAQPPRASRTTTIGNALMASPKPVVLALDITTNRGDPGKGWWGEVRSRSDKEKAPRDAGGGVNGGEKTTGTGWPKAWPSTLVATVPGARSDGRSCGHATTGCT